MEHILNNLTISDTMATLATEVGSTEPGSLIASFILLNNGSTKAESGGSGPGYQTSQGDHTLGLLYRLDNLFTGQGNHTHKTYHVHYGTVVQGVSGGDERTRNIALYAGSLLGAFLFLVIVIVVAFACWICPKHRYRPVETKNVPLTFVNPRTRSESQTTCVTMDEETKSPFVGLSIPLLEQETSRV